MRNRPDVNHIAQTVFDEVSLSNRVKLVDTEFNLQLNAGKDSTTSHPVKLTASVLGCTATDNGQDIIPPLDCSSLRELHVSVNGTGTVNLLVSPNSSGNFFYEVGGANQIHKICGQRVKVTSIDVIGDVHLVGRS